MAGRWGWLVLLAGLFAHGQAIWAAEHEERHFAIFVDGREAGSTVLDIDQKDDGLTYVTTRARVTVKRIIVLYSLTIDGVESWRDGKLVNVKSQAVENGKSTNVSVSLENQQLRARVNGSDRVLPTDVWTSTFWKLPDAKFHNKELALFENDTGKSWTGQLVYLGTDQLTIMNQPQQCRHFRYTGGASPTDVWFDGQNRLVRQEFVEMGHKTVGQLIRISR